MKSGRRGVVMIVVLWVCVMTMWIAFQISAETRLNGEEEIHRLRRSTALYLAMGGVYEALGRMGQPLPIDYESSKDYDQYWLPDGVPRKIQYETGEAIVIIEEETGKVNVNLANQAQLLEVFERMGLEGDEAENIADHIMDFVDADDLERLHGGEKAEYEAEGLSYEPFNGLLTSLDQLLLVPGVTFQLFYGNGLRREDADAEPTQLERVNKSEGVALPIEDSMFQLLTVYGNNVSLPTEEEEENEDTTTPNWQSGGTYRILSCGKSNLGPPGVILWLVVKYSPGSSTGYQVLFRKIL